MEYIVVVEVNGREVSYILNADSEIDAQHQALCSVTNSIIVKDCYVNEEAKLDGE